MRWMQSYGGRAERLRMQRTGVENARDVCGMVSKLPSYQPWGFRLGAGRLQGDMRGSGCARELLVCEVGAEQHARVLVMQRTREKMPTSRRDPKSKPRQNKYRETGPALQVEALGHGHGGACRRAATCVRHLRQGCSEAAR